MRIFPGCKWILDGFDVEDYGGQEHSVLKKSFQVSRIFRRKFSSSDCKAVLRTCEFGISKPMFPKFVSFFPMYHVMFFSPTATSRQPAPISTLWSLFCCAVGVGSSINDRVSCR